MNLTIAQEIAVGDIPELLRASEHFTGALSLRMSSNSKNDKDRPNRDPLEVAAGKDALNRAVAILQEHFEVVSVFGLRVYSDNDRTLYTDGSGNLSERLVAVKTWARKKEAEIE